MRAIHSVNYWYLEIALGQQRDSLLRIEEEFRAFIPKQISDFEEEKKMRFQKLKALNPNHTDVSLMQSVTEDIEIRASRKFQIHGKFDEKYGVETINIILLSHSLCEGLINSILSNELFAESKHELFELIEKNNLIEKWCVAPKILFPNYKIEKSQDIYENLVSLGKRRNAIVHSKSTLKDNEWKDIVKGTEYWYESISNISISKLKKYSDLPYRLLQTMADQIEDHSIKYFVGSSLRRKIPKSKFDGEN